MAAKKQAPPAPAPAFSLKRVIKDATTAQWDRNIVPGWVTRSCPDGRIVVQINDLQSRVPDLIEVRLFGLPPGTVAKVRMGARALTFSDGHQRLTTIVKPADILSIGPA